MKHLCKICFIVIVTYVIHQSIKVHGPPVVNHQQEKYNVQCMRVYVFDLEVSQCHLTFALDNFGTIKTMLLNYATYQPLIRRLSLR